MPQQLPVCVSIILCERVIEEAVTHNKSYIATFNQIYTHELPSAHDKMVVVASLTDCRQSHMIALEIARDTDEGEETIVHLEGKIGTEDPLAVIDLTFEVRGFPLLGYGVHTIRLISIPDGTVLGQRHFTVTEADLGSGTTPGGEAENN